MARKKIKKIETIAGKNFAAHYMFYQFEVEADSFDNQVHILDSRIRFVENLLKRTVPELVFSHEIIRENISHSDNVKSVNISWAPWQFSDDFERDINGDLVHRLCITRHLHSSEEFIPAQYNLFIGCPLEDKITYISYIGDFITGFREYINSLQPLLKKCLETDPIHKNSTL